MSKQTLNEVYCVSLAYKGLTARSEMQTELVM